MTVEKKKVFAGQRHVTSVTPDEVAQKAADDATVGAAEDAVAIDVWFVMRGHKDPVMREAMRAFTRVKKASPSEFDRIFADF